MFVLGRTGASWHIIYDGGDIVLDEETTCLACNLSNCNVSLAIFYCLKILGVVFPASRGKRAVD